ncbi:MAG: dihydroorotate dehydrogenase [Heliobacteriaceae bacterium]|jgi:dihydroorotate dehydrogenase (NAD+) catalytic subunit|nr:dihydroorotate dehydrogenase [Heliobacteriaceae bacterium]
MGMNVDLNGLTLKNPVIAASGTYGYNNEFDVFCDVSKLGATVTKAISLHPRPGNDWQRIFETDCGLINSIGLENVGIEKYLSTYQLINLSTIVNIAGSTVEEYLELAKICDKNGIKAIELNLSCPNVKCGCLEFGTDEEALYGLVSRVREIYSGHLTSKLTPNVTSIEKIAIAAEKAGANAISAINTVKALGLKLNYINGEFKKEYVRGGLSGKAVKPVALGAVERISKAVNIPVIGMGGIYTLEDVLEFFAVGAEAVQVGTANFTHPDTCERLVDELEAFMQTNGFATLDELKNKLRALPLAP